MPSIWKGHIVFGMVSVPVSMVTAAERSTTPLHLVHTAGGCLGRIRNRKICELEDREISSERDIGRGYETATGGIVPLTDADLDNLPLATAHAIELVAAIPADRIDPRQIGAASYYLAADASPAGARPYVLLVQALARRSQVALVKFAIRGDRERLGMLRPLGDVLILNALRWSDEVRTVERSLTPAPADVDEDELSAAVGLVNALSVGSLDDIPDLVDHYAQALDNLLDAKVHGRGATVPSKHPRPGPLVDLMAALRQSVRDAQASRGETPADTARSESGPRRSAPRSHKRS